MAIGLVGRKLGMSRIFTETGDSVPVTVIQVLPNRVTQLKTDEQDGYTAVQVTMGERKASRVNKPASGHFAKAEVEAGEGLWEFRVSAQEVADLNLGTSLAVQDHFQEGQLVDVVGMSKGKGYAGVVKRHNFRTQDATHGNSLAHRAPGSIGQNQTPGRVFKGKKMAGRMGNERCTVQNQEVVRIDAEQHLLMLRGAVPGAINGRVILKTAVKAKQKVAEGA